jgi:hypothetical protein
MGKRKVLQDHGSGQGQKCAIHDHQIRSLELRGICYLCGVTGARDQSCFLATGAPTSTSAVVTYGEDSDNDESDCKSMQSASDGTECTVAPATATRTGTDGTADPAGNASPMQVNFEAHPEVQGVSRTSCIAFMSVPDTIPLPRSKLWQGTEKYLNALRPVILLCVPHANLAKLPASPGKRRQKCEACCTMLKVGMKVLSDNNCELLVLDKSDKKQGS